MRKIISMYKSIIRPILFLFSPETIHDFVFFCLKIGEKIPGIAFLVQKSLNFNHPKLERELFGIKFPNPIGLAAGLDKEAEVFNMFGHMGFGFVEIGTITPKPQSGNPKPRLFRLLDDKALLNRMGFNNHGMDCAIKNLRKKHHVIIGGNIGKNKLTPNDQAIGDYLKCLESLHPYVDYFAINVSSPNTPNLRELQEAEPLKKILTALKEKNATFETPRPVLLKIAPDLNFSQIDSVLDIIKQTQIDGIIATNTSISRKGLQTPAEKVEKYGTGGISGKPLKQRSTEIIKYINDKTNGQIPIIGVGGIFSAEDAIEKINAGASLVQLYTGFIYQGPAVVKKINKQLVNML